MRTQFEARAPGTTNTTSVPQLRYSFTAQFLRGSAIFAVRAHEIENDRDQEVTDELKVEHRAYVFGAIVQCAAGLEAEVSEILHHGVGHHLGSSGIDAAAQALLLPLAGNRRPHMNLGPS